MPLTSKLRADYIELINKQLDTIQIDSLEDFALAEQALQNIILPVEGYLSPEKYREKIFFIKDYLHSPEDYVQHEQDYKEYQQIIRERIAAKAGELQSLDMTQKQSYIQHQQAQRAQTTINQQTMAQRRPPQPGSDAHVQTEDEWLAERQQQFNRELGAGNSTQSWQRRHLQMINDISGPTDHSELGFSLGTGEQRQDRAGRNRQQLPINAEQTQRLLGSYQRYIAEYNQTHDNVQNDFFTDMGNNRNFNWFQVGRPQRLIPSSQEDIQAIRHLDTVRQEEMELHSGQRGLIEQGLAFNLDEAQLESVRVHVIDKLSVVRAMWSHAFSMLDFKELTIEQISNVGTVALTAPNCIAALSDGRTTIAQLAAMNVESLRQAVESDNYPNIGLRS